MMTEMENGKRTRYVTLRAGLVASLAGVLVVGLGFILVFHQNSVQDSRARDRDRAEALTAAYEAEYRAFTEAHNQWQRNTDQTAACLRGIPASEAIRQYFRDEADHRDKQATFATSDEERAFYLEWADQTRNNSFATSKPRTKADCGDPGPEPTPPTPPPGDDD